MILDDHRNSFETLRVFSSSWWDLQQTLTGIGNRLGGTNKLAEAQKAAKDGDASKLEELHTRIPADIAGPLLSVISDAEHTWRLALTKAYRRLAPTEIVEWQKNSPGIGDHTVARLLGVIGHPAIAFPMHWEPGADGEDKRLLIDDEPYHRTLAQLWAYCGVGDPERRIRKGMSQDELFAAGNRLAGPTLHLLAQGVVQAKNSEGVYGAHPWIDSDPTTGQPIPERQSSGAVTFSDPAIEQPSTEPVSPGRNYRDAYEAFRCHYETAPCEKHPDLCPLGHKNNKALRRVKKEILRDLWLAANAHLDRVETA